MDRATAIVKERKEYEKVLEKLSDLDNREDAVEYAKALTKLIFDYKMVGLVYEYYTDDVIYKGADGSCFSGKEAVATKNLSLLAAFTDLKIQIEESFASGDFVNEFKVYQRLYCEGTNNGPSIYGGPTMQKINRDNCRGESLFVFRKVDGRWKVATEYTIRSDYFIEKLIREHQPEKEAQ